MKEDIFEASLTPEINQKVRQFSVVTGKNEANIQFYDPLDESFEGKMARLKKPVFQIERLWNLLRGSYDVHQHSGPSPHTQRLFDEIDLAIHGCYVGLGGIVFKEQYMPSIRSVKLVQKIADQWAEEHNRPKIELYGGVCLNYSVGGLNPEAVICSYRMGGKYVWLPNVDSNHHRKMVGQGEGQGIDVIDENDNLVPRMKEILELMAETDMVLAPCHQSTRERWIVVKEAVKMGVERIEIIHVNYPLTWLTPEQCKMFADLGAYIGIYAIDETFYTWDDVMAIYKAVGPERIVLGSDRGHPAMGHPIDGLRRLIFGFLQSGVPDEHVKLMCRTNARNLLH